MATWRRPFLFTFRIRIRLFYFLAANYITLAIMSKKGQQKAWRRPFLFTFRIRIRLFYFIAANYITLAIMSKKGQQKAVPVGGDISSVADDDGATLTIDRFESMLSRVTAAMADSFNRCIEKLIVSLDQKLSQRLDVQSGEIFQLSKRLDSMDKRNSDLLHENTLLKETVKQLTLQVEKSVDAADELEQHSRNDNLLLHGVALPADGSREGELGEFVVGLLNRHFPDANITRADISIAHRNGSSHPGTVDQTSAVRIRPPPILIRFTRKCVRSSLLNARRTLKGKNISITEQLTTRRAQLLKKANELATSKKIESAWSHDGRILVKTRLNRTVRIHAETDLIQFA